MGAGYALPGWKNGISAGNCANMQKAGVARFCLCFLVHAEVGVGISGGGDGDLPAGVVVGDDGGVAHLIAVVVGDSEGSGLGQQIAVGIDIKENRVAIKGWTTTSDKDALAFCSQMQAIGVKTIICTDISKDGAMQGANHGLYKTLSEKFSLQIIASGGVSTLADIQQLAGQKIHGAIVGKAYYTGAFDLAQAIEVAK